MDPKTNQIVKMAEAEAGKLETQAVFRIRKEEDLKKATEQLATIKRALKNLKQKKKDILDPLKESQKKVNELFKQPLDKYTNIEAMIKEAMLKYNESVEKRAANKTAKIEEKVDSGGMTMADGMAKASKLKQAQTSVKTEHGGMQTREVKKIRITDPSQLPVEYFLRESVIEALRKEVSKDFKQGKDVPAGAEVYKDKVIAGIS